LAKDVQATSPIRHRGLIIVWQSCALQNDRAGIQCFEPLCERLCLPQVFPLGCLFKKLFFQAVEVDPNLVVRIQVDEWVIGQELAGAVIVRGELVHPGGGFGIVEIES
jgi:hypothetical protein